MNATIIPTPEELRTDIRARSVELRAMRRLLRLAVAADALRQAREARPLSTEPRREAAAVEGNLHV
jgi:hypothetical protein